MKITKKDRYTKIEFDSYLEILEYIKPTDEMLNPVSHKKRDGSKFCSYTWKEAMQYMQTGWKKGTAKVDKIQSRIKHRISENGEGYDVQHDVTGDFIDIGRYVTGEPEVFGYIEPTPAPEQALDIVIDTCYAWYVEEAKIYNRGAAITTIIDELLKEYFLNVQLVMRLRADSAMKKDGKKENLKIVFNVNMKNEYSRDLMAFYLANTAFFRRIGFAIMETYFNKPSLGLYGYVMDVEPTGKEGEILFSKTSSEMDKYATVEKAVQTTKEILEQYTAKNGPE